MNKNEFYDGIVIGGGPAGLTAALYLARAKYRVLVVEKEKFGGQITITSSVVNYPGVAHISGTALTEIMRRQAEDFGAEFLNADVQALHPHGNIKIVTTDKGKLHTLGIIIATGASPRAIGFDGEMRFRGHGVAYCATCDGEFFTGLDVFVIGGGFAAAEESIFLTKYARKVTVIVRENDFTCAAAVADEVKVHPNIDIHYNTEIIELGGEETPRYAVFKNNRNGTTWKYTPPGDETFGVFVFAGYAPANDLCKGVLALDDYGYLITDINRKTDIDGVYGAGDICIKNLRQVVTAVSDGAVAATSMEKYLSSQYEKMQLPQRKINKLRRENKNSDVSGISVHPSTGGFLDKEIKQQLKPLFSRFQKNIVLKASLNHKPIAGEVEVFLKELSDLSPLISYQTVYPEENDEELPMIEVCAQDGSPLGTAFHGVPGGHEFNSFVICLYNASGEGQKIDVLLLERIKKLSKPINIKIAVSLSCTQCPDLVAAVQRIALENCAVRADIYDLAHFPSLKEKYKIMSVPCMIINDDNVYFGKKGIEDVLNIIETLY